MRCDFFGVRTRSIGFFARLLVYFASLVAILGPLVGVRGFTVSAGVEAASSVPFLLPSKLPPLVYDTSP